MSLTRRAVLQGGASLAALSLASRASLAEARGLLVDPLLEEIVSAAIRAARRAGASYADIRLVRRRSESVSTRDDHIAAVGSDESYGLGVRVLADGAWGFAASSRVDPQEAAHVAERSVAIGKANARISQRPVQLAAAPAVVDVWQTPLLKDPFKIPLADKAELLLAIHGELIKVPGVKYTSGLYQGFGDWKLFASSEGSFIEQNLVRVFATYGATAVDGSTGDFVEVRHSNPPRQAGWEYIESSPLLTDARRIGENTVEKLKAPSVEAGRKELILSPTNLWLTIHESVGHPTELDRALGYEANFAGTSFATPEKLGKLRYASPIVTLYADKTTPGGLATCGYDDEGVRTGRWDLVKKGLFVAYQTTREQAGWIGEKASRGTSGGEDYKGFPFQRMPNVSLAPGEKDLGVQDLIAATEDGIFIEGDGSWSIDQQRYNFQFGGQMFYEIKKGKVTHALKDVAYQSNTTEFWNSCDLLGGPKEWLLGGSISDGKGEPVQANAMSHGCPPARFAKVNVLNTNRRRRS